MKISSKIIGLLFLFLPFSVFSEISICDNANISYTGSTVTEICNGGTKITNVSGITSFTGAYQDIPTGYWGTTHSYTGSDINYSMNTGYVGTKHNYSISDIIYSMNTGYVGTTHSYTGSDINYSMNTGYVGSKFGDEEGKKTITKTSYNTPVGFFSTYKNTSLFFPTLEEILYTAQKIYFANTDSGSGGGSSAYAPDTCEKPNQVSNIQGNIKKQTYTDILELAWDAQGDDTKFKIIQSYPSSETFYVDQGSTIFERQDLEDGRSYHYFVVPYNDCGDGLYSDSIQVEYKKEVPTQPYLEIQGDTIYLKNTGILGEGEVDLKCSLYGEEITSLSGQDSIYLINISYIEEPFECYATYYDINEEFQQTQTVTNLPNKTYITQQEAGDIFMSDATKTFETTYYYLHPTLTNLLTYEQFSLYLINTKANIILTDKELSLKILKNLGLIGAEVNGLLQIKYEDFLEILPKIGENFRQDILDRITQDFELTPSKVYEDTLKSYLIYRELKNESFFNQEQLTSCFIYEGCGNVELYNSFSETINTQYMASELEYRNLGIDVESEEIVTWEIYIDILFKVLGKEGFYEEGYSLSEYSEFVNVLSEGMLYGESLGEEEVGFLAYERMKINFVLNDELFSDLQKLTKNYLRRINFVYNAITDTKKLLLLEGIRQYLGE